MTTGGFAESAFSQAVDLLERSVSLLKESPLERNVSSPLEERQGQRALANYRLSLISVLVAFFNRVFQRERLHRFL